MRVIVCGSRDFDDDELLSSELARIYDSPERSGGHLVIVHGAARGADMLAGRWAQLVPGAAEEPHPANWTGYRNAAGPIRNCEMAKAGADLCLAFWDGKSAGTKDMITQAVCHGIPVRIVPWRKQ